MPDAPFLPSLAPGDRRGSRSPAPRRPPVRLDLLVSLTRLHREGIAARMTRRLVPDVGERRALVRWEQRAVREVAPMLSSVGWPGVDVVGEVGAEAAWWIALTCDQHTAFQQDAHRALVEAVEEGRAPARHLAYLEDRLQMHAGAPQEYGTQHLLFADGSVELHPVKDPRLMTGLRRHAGLPVAGYRQADLRLLSLTRGPHVQAPVPRFHHS
ncbi:MULTISPECIES: DUF6624 domain-containing protein [Streptomyces]|uniref:DUF6624 domain-containing protein n=1 Tax=Streptomyces TaxID=1883 RepID=UPI00163BB36D|nr:MULTISPECIES: DUF6624 domain-containing protein [Streptomyces]MBC2879313.1 hypothetical protein [Streptomyces sp. TYQ1024]UBI40087.1 hypothetical protein K7I03_28940 [Streptomyces mobaraensis]UKW32666.1 hypothetical protein MCU78_28870 [Streptomyces sp. TYQ1024]